MRPVSADSFVDGSGLTALLVVVFQCHQPLDVDITGISLARVLEEPAQPPDDYCYSDDRQHNHLPWALVYQSQHSSDHNANRHGRDDQLGEQDIRPHEIKVMLHFLSG